MWKHVDDKAKEYNTNFINVMEIDSMIRTAEVVLVGALNRKESRGAHSRTDYPQHVTMPTICITHSPISLAMARPRWHGTP